MSRRDRTPRLGGPLAALARRWLLVARCWLARRCRLAAYRLDLGDAGSAPTSPTRPPSRPRSRRRPRASTCPPLRRPEPVAAAAERPRSTAAAVRRALAPAAARPRPRPLGRAPRSAAARRRPRRSYATGTGAVTSRPRRSSCSPSAAALDALGPDHRFDDHASCAAPAGDAGPRRRRRPAAGPDAPAPTDDYPRARRPASTLARQTARRCAGRRRRAVRLSATTTRCSPARRSTRTGEPDYIPDDVVAPITALWVDEGRDRRRLRPGRRPRRPPRRGVRRGARERRGSQVDRRARRDRRRRRRRRASPRSRSAAAVADRRARARGQRQRGAPRCWLATSALARGRRRRRSPAAPTAVARGAERPRRRRCAAPCSYDGSGLSRDNRLTADTAARRAAGWPPTRTSPSCAPVADRAAGRRLHRLAGRPVRRRRPRRAAAGCAPRPAPSPASAALAGIVDRPATARRWCSSLLADRVAAPRTPSTPATRLDDARRRPRPPAAARADRRRTAVGGCRVTRTASAHELAMVDWDLAVADRRRGWPGDGPDRSARDEADDGGRRAARRRRPLDRAGPRLHRAGRRGAAPRRCWSSTGPAGSRPTPTASRPCSAPVIDKLAEKKGAPTGLAQAVGSRVTGAEVGALLGFLAGKVLGQFDPFYEPSRPAAAGRAQHRPRRARARVDPADFRLWVCLHEETHRVQFTAVPWLRDHLLGEIAALGRAPSSPVPAARGRRQADRRGAQARRRRRQPARRCSAPRSSRRSSTGSPA